MAAILVEITLTPFVFLFGNVQSDIGIVRRKCRSVTVDAEIAALLEHAGSESCGDHTRRVTFCL